MKVLRSRSVEGLDPTLFEMDTICNTVTAFYHILHNYPINTYVAQRLLAFGLVMVLLLLLVVSLLFFLLPHHLLPLRVRLYTQH